MIARSYNHSVLPVFPGTFSMSTNLNNIRNSDYYATNMELYFIFQMNNRYFKLLESDILKSKLDSIHTQIMEIKIEFNFENNKLLQIEKDRDRFYNVNITPNEGITLSHAAGLEYFNNRHIESTFRLRAIKNKLETNNKLFYGIIYLPLLDCVKNIVLAYQKNQFPLDEMTRLKTKGKWDLSKILLIIFKNTEIKVWSFDSFSQWNSVNIFSHPLILEAETILQNELSAYGFSRAVDQIGNMHTLLAVEKTFAKLERVYHLMIIRSLAMFFQNYEEKITFIMKIIFDPAGIGKHIYSYLCGDIHIDYCLENIPNIPRKRARDFS